jgi:tetratricopeptide (TPR) repeat protein
MRAYVFTAESLKRYAGRFVWLSINTEDQKNAGFLEKYPMPVLPTLLVLDQTGNKILLRYAGGTTTDLLEKLLAGVSTKTPSGPDALVRQADSLAAAGEHAKAANLYASAIKSAPKGWKRLGPVSESLLISRTIGKEYEGCAYEALALYPRLQSTRSGAIIASSGLDCGLSIEKKNLRRARLIGELENITREALKDPAIKLTGDDRSEIYRSLIGSREEAADEKGALALIREWAAFLDKAAAEARTPEQRAVYDAHRLSAYAKLGSPEKAIPMLEQSERDFPEDYNPPVRLASVYALLKQYDKAHAALDRALARANGPRKVTILSRSAELYVRMSDKDAAKKTFAEAIVLAKKLPSVQMEKSTIAALEKRLAELSQ